VQFFEFVFEEGLLAGGCCCVARGCFGFVSAQNRFLLRPQILTCEIHLLPEFAGVAALSLRTFQTKCVVFGLVQPILRSVFRPLRR
jgi:hypothetical protein